MSAAAQLIKDRLSIVDVVGSYIKLENAGSNLKAKCPFHNEKSPSFFVSPARGSYYCFGCGVKGDIFTFVQEYEKIDFLGSLKILAERSGIELDQFKSENYQKIDRQYKLIDLACSFFQNKLSEIHKEYLRSRGLKDEGIIDWRIGFAPDEWRSLMDYMIAQKIDGRQVATEELIATGLIKRGEQNDRSKGDKIYDRFRSRIIFPIFDSSGRVIAFSGRMYGKDNNGNEKEMGPKYLNSPEMDLFNKSEALYGFDRAKQAMRERGYAVLVEGQMDLLMSHQVGVTNTVATSGTALTKDHLWKIGRMTKNLIFMYDADNAGYGATRRGERMAIEQGFDVKVATMPKGEDPASLIGKDKQLFMKCLKESTNVISFYLSILIEKFEGQENQHELLKAIEKELIPDIALTPSAIRRSELISQISLKSKIPEKALAEEVEKTIKKIEREGGFAGPSSFQSNQENGQNIQSAISHSENPEENPLGNGNKKSRRSSSKSVDIALRRSVALVIYLESKAPASIPLEQIVILWARIDEMLIPDDGLIVTDLREFEKEELLFEAEMLFGTVEKATTELDSLLTELEERSLKEQLGRFMAELQLAEKAKDKVKSDEIILKCQEISLKLSSLHKKRRLDSKNSF